MQKMMTKTLARQLPPLYSTDGQGNDAIAHGHWFTSAGDWFATEYDASSGDCFGLVKFYGEPAELGYFNIHEFERINAGMPGRIAAGGRFDLVERDLHWTPRTVAECRNY